MRIIDKLPQIPHLNEKSIRMISDFLFLPDKPFECANDDCEYSTYVFQIMGNIAFLKDMFSENLLSKVSPDYKIVPRLIITGGIQPEYKQDSEETRLVKRLYEESGKYDWNDVLTIPQSVIINNRLQKMPYNQWHDERKPLLDTKSTNTKANFSAVKEEGWYENIAHLRLLATAESTLRVMATATKQLPYLHDIATVSYIPTFPELGLRCDKEHWALHPLSQRYVYGELLRVIKYDETGDIKLTRESKTKLNNIVNELGVKQR